MGNPFWGLECQLSSGRRLHWLWTGAVSSLTSPAEDAMVYELSVYFGEYCTMYCGLGEFCNRIWWSCAFDLKVGMLLVKYMGRTE